MWIAENTMHHSKKKGRRHPLKAPTTPVPQPSWETQNAHASDWQKSGARAQTWDLTHALE